MHYEYLKSKMKATGVNITATSEEEGQRQPGGVTYGTVGEALGQIRDEIWYWALIYCSLFSSKTTSPLRV